LNENKQGDQGRANLILIKEGEKGRKRGGKIVKSMLQIIKAVCVGFEAVMPDKMAEVWLQLGMESDVHSV